VKGQAVCIATVIFPRRRQLEFRKQTVARVDEIRIPHVARWPLKVDDNYLSPQF
jgi:hypothetical protein